MFNSCAVLISKHCDARKGKEFNNKVAPPRFDIQFLDVSLPTPLSRVIDEYVSVSKVIFHGLFEFLNVSLGRYVDAHDENVSFVVHLEDCGFCRFKLCDATPGKDESRCSMQRLWQILVLEPGFKIFVSAVKMNAEARG